MASLHQVLNRMEFILVMYITCGETVIAREWDEIWSFVLTFGTLSAVCQALR